jgi:hypothetical protein
MWILPHLGIEFLVRTVCSVLCNHLFMNSMNNLGDWNFGKIPQESGVLPDIISIFRDLESNNSLGFNHHIGKKTSDNLVWVLNYDESWTQIELDFTSC